MSLKFTASSNTEQFKISMFLNISFVQIEIVETNYTLIVNIVYLPMIIVLLSVIELNELLTDYYE